ncbi:lysylphosphatidylglycerol synthase domain-containing protein [Reichenbachiella carrageenanivorans]|uniref:Lysylphosphatidylglycerol synthase domain-containing protein n=1 Tax=Reichenbachiella carrageenanivorans TaxID=2979869 RepID=A0ABY6CYA0_9BACT|nr:lysylphosphatidylglycerol synthase domain-containing protein [Reichenbachiella carrageenanivorans]UXX78896.1 lysylphosphatidylglycerol synthase domain-containing protein [Reichenbachiella carrageenanivorans]
MIRVLAKSRNTGWGRALNWAWVWLLPAFILGVVALKLINDPDKLNQLLQVRFSNWAGLAFCLFLLPFNVVLEAWKWQSILKPIEYKPLQDCVKVILSGKSLNVISPLGIGDAFARYFGIATARRNQIYAALLMDRFSQLLPTLVFGAGSVFYLLAHGFVVPVNSILLTVSVAGVLFSCLGLWGWWYRADLREYAQLIMRLDTRQILKIMTLAVARYAVFSIQFLLIFWSLGADLSFTVLCLGVAWIFLIKTLVPNISVLGDLVKRQLSAVLFFSFFTLDVGLVIVASFLVWLVNIVLPALVGIPFVSQLKRSF